MKHTMQRCATLRMCARSATELPPNFITVSITVLISFLFDLRGQKRRACFTAFSGPKKQEWDVLGPRNSDT